MRGDDWVAIRRLQEAYADIVTRRAWGELDGVFDPAVDITIAKAASGVLSFSGPAAFAGFVDRAMADFVFFEFVILNAHIEPGVADDEATSRMFMTEIRQDRAGQRSQVYGRYDDRFARDDAGRWWFVDRRYRTIARTDAGFAEALTVFPGGGAE